MPSKSLVISYMFYRYFTGLCIIILGLNIPLFAQNLSDGTSIITIPGSTVNYKMVLIPGGSFKMGSPDTEQGRENDEGPQKLVKIDPFWMGACEVTYDEYEIYMNEEKDKDPKPDAITRPSPPYIDFTLGMGKQGGYPANSMSQYGALSYCYWLYKKTGEFYRLPTEAEWEYACRAGSQTAYSVKPEDLPEYAWFLVNSKNKYHRVGQLKPNAWGLYDMAGNVQEWTLDQYSENYFKAIGDHPVNPVIKPVARHPRTLKGGSYQDNAEKLRSAERIKSDLEWNARDPQIPRSKWWNADAPFVGFRLVRPAKKLSKEEIEQFFSDNMIK